MDIESFQKSFKNNEINIKFYLLVVSILFSIILIIIGFNNNIEDYYVTQGIVNKENVNSLNSVSYTDTFIGLIFAFIDIIFIINFKNIFFRIFT